MNSFFSCVVGNLLRKAAIWNTRKTRGYF